MPSVTTKHLAYITAVQFKESFYEPAPEIGYVYIGNHLSYPVENTPPTIADTVYDEKSIWDNMMAAKKVTGTDVELVIPRVNWTANTVYKQCDDKVNLDQLIEPDASINVKPFYVYTSERNVYKCLSNGRNGTTNSAVKSTVEPRGDYTSSNGNIKTSDGYLWKYMYKVSPSNKFLTDQWIPVPASADLLDYTTNRNLGVIDGELTTIYVSNSGSNFVEANINVVSFNASTNLITILNPTTQILDNVSANMFVTGTGIAPETYITNYEKQNNRFYISSDTIAAGGGIPSPYTTANQLSLTTRIYIEGDGTRVVATPTINAAGNLEKVTISTIGTQFSRANVFVYGTGANSGVSLRPIFDPKYGHGYNPAKELAANSVMISLRIGEIDSTENGKISSNTTFRQYGLLVNPHKYGEQDRVTSANANSVVDQTTAITIVAGPFYSLDEYVYQGTANNATAYGYLISQSSNEVKLTNVIGTFRTGVPLNGFNSGTSRLVVGVGNPEFEPYSGDVLYTENTVAITRADGQAEHIKLIVRF
jgi:hypothetical protein